MSSVYHDPDKPETSRNFDQIISDGASLCLWGSILIVLCYILILAFDPSRLSLFRIAGILKIVPILVFGIILSLYMIHRNLTKSHQEKGIPETTKW